MRVLLEDQSKAINKLSKFKVGALFMEPGTGKTATAYEFAKGIPDVDYILWFAPYRTIHAPEYESSLPYELEKCGGIWTKYDLVGIESISNSSRIYLELHTKLSEAKKPLIIVDESLKIKNWEAKRTQRIITLGKLAEYKMILNGTPISRNLLDVWSQLEFLSPKILKMSLGEFKQNYCEYTTVTKNVNGYKVKKEFITGFHNIDHLYSIISHYVYECDLKLDVKKRYNSIRYTVGVEEKKEYEYWKEFFLKLETMMMYDNNIFIRMVQKLQHSYCKTQDKVDKLFDLFNKTHSQNQTIIFCKYRDSAELCRNSFPESLVLTYGKHTYGLNLQNRNVTVFFDKTWDYAQRLQAENRTYRNGQFEDCLFYDLDGNINLDNLIDSNIARKESMLEYFRRVGLREFKRTHR